jgi:MoxR-like ATPase
MDVPEASDACASVLETVEASLIADRGFLETVLTGVIAKGHVLLEDVPGTGKTLTARSVATALGLSFSRVQFTPDLLPTDVTGSNVYNERDRSFEFREGPIFANVVLADEINRAPPKTQSALLEAMEEEQVTVDGTTHHLPDPFFVIATQNPVESEGSLHPDETVYLDGELRTARDAIAHAEREGELVHDGPDTRMYAVDATTQTLEPDARLVEREAMVYETDYEGRIYRVRTKTGREVRVSGNHPFLVNRAGTIQWVEARDLDEDDHLVAPDRLGSVDEPFPTHEETIGSLAEEFTVVRRETVDRLAETIDGGDEDRLDRDDIDSLRVVLGWSKRELADRAGVNYDRVLNHLDGAATDVGGDLSAALREGANGLARGDHVEAFRPHRFERGPTDAEAGFLLGFVLSDGHYTDGSVAIYQSNHPDQFDRWVDLVSDLGFDVKLRELRGGREAKVDSKPFVRYLETRYGLDDPMSVLAAPEPFRRAFLEIFLLAESHYDAEHRRITFTQKDRDVTNLIAHLLLQFEIRPWVKDRGRVYRIEIQGEDVATYLEEFTWPGQAPDVDSFRSSHRVTPVDTDELRTIIEALGVDRDGAFGDREWYQSYRMARGGRDRMTEASLRCFLEDVETELTSRESADVRSQALTDLGAAARESGIAITDVADATGLSRHRVWQSYEGDAAPDSAVQFVSDVRERRTRLARRHIERLRGLVSGDVFYDRVVEIEAEPYEGRVIGLSVPETHNYLAGLGACGISHNTFPLPEAQVDRFAVKTAVGYPDEEGEVELLRRRAARSERSPSPSPVLEPEQVLALRETPETVRVEEDLLRYMASVARATRRDRRVSVGVSPRGTQRLFEAARARAVLAGREYVTPDDVKRVAQPVLAHRLVLTPDAKVEDVRKRDVIEYVLSEVAVPTL